MCLIFVKPMLPAVNFYNQFPFDTDKVHDISADRMLAFEFKAIRHFAAKPAPEDLFLRSGAFTQSFCEFG